MWWNFVGRTRDEIDAAYASWEAGDDRFGTVRVHVAADPGQGAVLAGAAQPGLTCHVAPEPPRRR